jgi:LacI family transcriptional regulator
VKSLPYSDIHFSNERLKGFKNEFLKQNLPLDDSNIIYVDAQPGAPFSVKAFEVLLNRIRDFTAVFTYDDYIAAGILNLLQHNGINVPSDCSIIGFDDSPLVSYWSSPSITVIKQPDDIIAFEAINLIMGKNDNSNAGSFNGNICTIKPKLIIRESVKKIS